MSAPHRVVDPRLSVNDILRFHPSAATVLGAYRIGGCCRGDQSLAAAATDLGLDPKRIAAEIAAEVPDGQLPRRCSCGHLYPK